MKKLLLFAIIVGGSLSFSSCSKDEECKLADGSTYNTNSPIFSDEEECALVGGTME